jgi:hypothetical protein
VPGGEEAAVLLQPPVAKRGRAARAARPGDGGVPGEFLRTHGDAEIVVADYVAAKPDIRLR